MGIKTHEVLSYSVQDHYAWYVWCPACDTPHSFDKRWSFNGNHQAPTFAPSVLVHESPGRPRCHSFLTDGIWNYLADCTHEMKGKSAPAPDWASTRWGGMDAHGVVKNPRLPSDMTDVVNPEHLAMGPKNNEEGAPPPEAPPVEQPPAPPPEHPEAAALYAASRKHMKALEGPDVGLPTKPSAMLLAYIAATECESTEELAAHGTEQTIHRAKYLRTFAPVVWFQVLDANAEGVEAACHKANLKAVPAKALQDFADIFARA